MTKVCLVNDPSMVSFHIYGMGAGIPTRMAYLASILEKNGIEYDVLDLKIEAIKKFGLKEYTKIISTIESSGNLNYLIKSFQHKRINRFFSWIQKEIGNASKNSQYMAVNGDNPVFAINSMKIAKEANKKIKCIVGGKVATLMPGKYMYDFVDYIYGGFADENFANIIRKKQNKPMTLTEYSYPNEVLTPNYDKIDLTSYFKLFSYANLITSFGCNNKCGFCNHRDQFKLIKRNKKDIEKEIDFFRNYGINKFLLIDSQANPDNDHINTLVNIFGKYPDVKWSAFFRASGKMDIKNIKESGCCFASFGIETSRNRLQRLIGKHLNIKEAKKIIRSFKKHRILTRGSFIYDLPEETLSDFIANLVFVKSLDLDFYEFHKLSIRPGSKMFDRSLQLFNGYLKENYILEKTRSPNEVMDIVLKDMIAGFLNKRMKRKISKIIE